MKFSHLYAAAGLAAVAFAAPAGAQTVTGAGASFPAPVYVKWAEAFNKETGVQINYQSSGSGNGIKAIKGNTVVFGATDAPLSGKDLEESGLVQFPTVIGGVVPIVNLEGIKPGEIALDGETLAKIFLGEIKKWDDAAIKALNPDVKLPSTAIAVVRRADSSGTTFNFTSYLSKVSAEWKDKLGVGTTVQWPVGLGAPGNDGVANNVAKIAGSIGYVEYVYAKANNLSYTRVKNKDGKFVAPSSATFQAAAAHADWKSVPGFGVILADQAGADSWPITAATFVLVHKEPKDKAQSAAALKFFDWAYEKGASIAEELSYIPLPKSVTDQIRAVWAAEVKNK
ncbi:phosphate transport system substrate-binding protein [Pseudochelatococcus lubricantis]|uniref:Phosphate-binding protein PstS n=1 Tax=Pseudochelatococcus lubricantis TaxID=1538102 RepID=A0ABX0UYW4_9HYPH|nr:phosphate transport system substrate-binding protein [Pseudochelatococcus lubricantis]